MKKSKNPFPHDAKLYHQARPDYPQTLIDYLISRCQAHQCAWDVATGNGQIASRLASYFQEVIATDMSAQQIAQATLASNITYRLENAEEPSLADNSVDLITGAQAFPWFNLDLFYKEVKRVAKPNGIIAAFGYRMLHITPEADALIDKLIHNIVKDYWDVRNDKIHDEQYQSLYFPFLKVEHKIFTIHLKWSVHQVLALLESYSACRNYAQQTGILATESIKPELLALMGNEIWEVKIPVYGKIGKVK